mmetsp:Transcript_27675/g.42403  ORF Transcript_27675/g.42403 Transcript_27675/m.42403 type:complete len:99 (+) Transcript_27675:14-310(+)
MFLVFYLNIFLFVGAFYTTQSCVNLIQIENTDTYTYVVNDMPPFNSSLLSPSSSPNLAAVVSIIEKKPTFKSPIKSSTRCMTPSTARVFSPTVVIVPS